MDALKKRVADLERRLRVVEERQNNVIATLKKMIEQERRAEGQRNLKTILDVLEGKGESDDK